MDIPLVLESLRPSANWGPSANSDSTYQELRANWADKNISCPTLEEMRAEWKRLQDEKPAIESARIKAEANGVLNKNEPTAAIIRAVLAILVDEINLIRAAVRLPPRTVQQLNNAIRSKVEAGVADAPQTITKIV